jgi:RNA polymerase sigma-70 factor (ECF subfamily)
VYFLFMNAFSGAAHGVRPIAPTTGDMAIEATVQRRRIVDLEERGWLPRHCRGDASAFPALLAAYRRPVYGYLVRCGVVHGDRDDLFQNIFLKIHAAAASYDPGRPLAPWLFAIVANMMRNHFRDRPAALASVEDTPDPPDPAPGPDHVAESRETVVWVEMALLALPPAQREVLLLVAVAGMRQREVADALNMPINTVKTHLRRARLTLADGLAGRDEPRGDAGGNHG